MTNLMVEKILFEARHIHDKYQAEFLCGLFQHSVKIGMVRVLCGFVHPVELKCRFQSLHASIYI